MSEENVENSVSVMRKKIGLSQEELAKAVDVSRQTIISLEKGNYKPSVLLAMKIARHFKCKTDDLFSLK